MKKTCYYFLFLIIISCIEPIEIKSTTQNKELLVIEATITNEFKKHEIKLSRTIPIDSFSYKLEKGAFIKIIDEFKNTYNFEEISTGKYRSKTDFSALKNTEYTLEIETSDGEVYTSKAEKITAESKIENITYIPTKNFFDQEGVMISVNSSSIDNDANYYRFEYEETYNILPPLWSKDTIIVTSETPPFGIKIETKKNINRDKVCYKTKYSDKIFQTETKSLVDNNIVNYPLRFLPYSGLILSSRYMHRYTIIVKQYVESFEAYNYYNILNKFSDINNVFSQIQTGNLTGNIHSKKKPDKSVIGYFSVASVSEKRVFFNRNELTSLQPTFDGNCKILKTSLTSEDKKKSPLIRALNNGYIFFAKTDDENPYYLTKKICGDCTVQGTNVKPVFWID